MLYLDRCLTSSAGNGRKTFLHLDSAGNSRARGQPEAMLRIHVRECACAQVTSHAFVGQAPPHHHLMSTSRRSPVLCRHGCVACNQPLAADAGISVLKRGGNAADAAVAVAAALNVTQPCSTGLGGDCFCLFYDAATRSVRGINGR